MLLRIGVAAFAAVVAMARAQDVPVLSIGESFGWFVGAAGRARRLDRP
jgi:hypothetical protein